jgi:hypothetical protein
MILEMIFEHNCFCKHALIYNKALKTAMGYSKRVPCISKVLPQDEGNLGGTHNVVDLNYLISS